MRKANVYMHGLLAGVLEEIEPGKEYRFRYVKGYDGSSISLTMPKEQNTYTYDHFPPFFEGLLPEGDMLEGLLYQLKIDKYDFFSQLVAVGGDMVGAVTVEEAE